MNRSSIDINRTGYGSRCPVARQARGVFVDAVDVKAMFAVKRRSFTEQGRDFLGGFWVIIGVDRLCEQDLRPST
jgi:hypothetical protein